MCSICDKQFQYLSKYKRHLLTASHQRFEESLRINLQSEQDNNVLTDEVDSSTLSMCLAISSPPHPEANLADQGTDREVNVVAC